MSTGLNILAFVVAAWGAVMMFGIEIKEMRKK